MVKYMYLSDLLTLISDLHPNFQFFYQIKENGSSYPISKIQVEGDQCLLLIGKKAKTIAQIKQLLGKLKYADIPVYVYSKELDQKEKIFGIQINLKQGQVYLL